MKPIILLMFLTGVWATAVIHDPSRKVGRVAYPNFCCGSGHVKNETPTNWTPHNKGPFPQCDIYWSQAAGTCQEWANAYASFHAPKNKGKDRCYMGPVKRNTKVGYEQKPVKCDPGYKIYDSKKLLVLDGIGYEWRYGHGPSKYWDNRWFLADRDFEKELTGHELNTWKSNCCIPDSKNKLHPEPTNLCTAPLFDCPDGYWNRGDHNFKKLTFGTGKNSKRIVTHFTGCCYSKEAMSKYYVYSSPKAFHDVHKPPTYQQEKTIAARCVGECSTSLGFGGKDWCYSDWSKHHEARRAGYCQEGTKFNAYQWAGFQDKSSCKTKRTKECEWKSCMDDGFGEEFCCLNCKWMYPKESNESVATTINAVLDE